MRKGRWFLEAGFGFGSRIIFDASTYFHDVESFRFMSPSGKLFFYTFFYVFFPYRIYFVSLIKRKLAHKGNYSFPSNQIIPYLCP